MSTTTDARSASIFASVSDDYHKYLPKSLQTRLKTKNMEKLEGPADSYDKVAHMMRLKVPHLAAAALLKKIEVLMIVSGMIFLMLQIVIRMEKKKQSSRKMKIKVKKKR